MAFDEEEEDLRIKRQYDVQKMAEEKKKKWELNKQLAADRSHWQKLQIIEEKKKKAIEETEKIITIKAFPIRQYLIESISGILSDGLAKLVRERPKDPLEQLVH
jgi:hypothetical protein